jgi:hypothetical protein
MRADMTDTSSKTPKNARSSRTSALALTLMGLAGGAMIFAAPVAQAAPAPQDAPKKDRFSLKVTNGKGKAGAPITMSVDATAKTVWHFNADFPTSLKLTPPAGVTVAKAKLKIPDATKFEEKAFSFPVKVTAAKPGKYEVKGLLKFAVCIESTCSMMKENVTFVVEAS